MGLLHIFFAYIFVPYVTITLSLFALGAFLPPTYTRIPLFFARCLAYIFCLFVCSIYGTTASIALNFVGMSGLSQWTTARAFKWSTYLLTQVWFDVEDESHASETRPAVYLSNHQTELDIALLGYIMPIYGSVTSKSSLKYYPFLGQFMYFSNTVFIDRADRSSALAVFDNAAKFMQKKRQNVLIFPEGTRSYYDHPDLLPFKKGAFHLAVQAQVPIVPVVCGNYNHVLNLKQMKFSSGTIPVKVLPAIETKGMTSADVPELTERVRNQMLKTIKELALKTQEKSGTSTAPDLRQKTKMAVAS